MGVDQMRAAAEGVGAHFPDRIRQGNARFPQGRRDYLPGAGQRNMDAENQNSEVTLWPFEQPRRERSTECRVQIE